MPLEELAELVNIGTLFAFVLVSIGVIVLRRTRPDLPRAFRVPLVPVLPILSALACLYLMLNLPGETWLRFLVWMALGFVVYFVYGRRRAGSTPRATARTPRPPTPPGRPDRSPVRVRSAGGPPSAPPEHAELTRMAISVLDVRDTFAAPHVSVPARATVADGRDRCPAGSRSPSSPPALIGVLEAVGLLAVALTGWTASCPPVRPAGWIVGAGSARARRLDRAVRRQRRRPDRRRGPHAAHGRRLRRDGAGRVLLVRRHRRRCRSPPPATSPCRRSACSRWPSRSASSCSRRAVGPARGWPQGPRARVRRPDPVQTHRLLATVTLGVIGPRSWRRRHPRPRSGRRRDRLGVGRLHHRSLAALPTGRAATRLPYSRRVTDRHILTAVAWPYANGPRHIGHVSGFGVPSDVFSRYHRMAGDKVLMVSGTDEHGTPITVAADAEGITPRRSPTATTGSSSTTWRASG